MSGVLLFVADYIMISFYLNLSILMKYSFIQETEQSRQAYDRSKIILLAVDVFFVMCLVSIVALDTYYDFSVHHTLGSIDQLVNDIPYVFLSVMVLVTIIKFRWILSKLGINQAKH